MIPSVIDVAQFISAAQLAESAEPSEMAVAAKSDGVAEMPAEIPSAIVCVDAAAGDSDIPALIPSLIVSL